MEITQNQAGDVLVMKLVGRLDANWCGHVENALNAAVRSGNHRIDLDMAGVSYVSSAGLRVLLSPFKQLRAIKGSFRVINPSATVRTVLDMAGFGVLISAETGTQTAPSPCAKGRTEKSAHATYEIFQTVTPLAQVKMAQVGEDTFLQGGKGLPVAEKLIFTHPAFAIGVGALGATAEECKPRFGEFLAVAGAAAYQPSDGSSRPDFVVSEGSLVPEGFILLGLSGTGDFPLLARFEAAGDARAVRLSELAQSALEFTKSPAVAFVAVTETAGLVGASLRTSPALAAGEDQFAFPKIRDRISFTTERAFRDTTSLIVGVAARPGHALQALLRPLAPDVIGHFHAASFPYRPLQKGLIELKPSVASLFESQNLQAVLHLLTDAREFNGAGESEFLRGAVWLAPLAP